MQKDYLVIDIETRDASGVSLDIEKRFVRKGNTKDTEKIGRKQDELKGGCLDLSPIAIIGLKSSASSVPVVLAVDHVGAMVRGVVVVSCRDELRLLSAAQEVLADVPRGVDVVTFAGYGFDLPKLRLAFVRYGLIVPECLFLNHQADLQHRMKDYLVKNYAFASLEECCQKVGIEFSKSIPGNEINAYIEAGRMAELVAYNVGDLLAEESLYKRICR